LSGHDDTALYPTDWQTPRRVSQFVGGSAGLYSVSAATLKDLCGLCFWVLGIVDYAIKVSVYYLEAKTIPRNEHIRGFQTTDSTYTRTSTRKLKPNTSLSPVDLNTTTNMSSSPKNSDASVSVREPLPRIPRYVSLQTAELSMTDLNHSYISDFAKGFDVLVDGGKTYFAYQDIAKSSKLFADKAAESVDDVMLVELKDVQPAVFNNYLNWLHLGRLAIRDVGDGEVCAYENVQKYREQKRGIDLYLLGDLLGDVDFRVHVLDLLITKIQTWGNEPEWIAMVYEAAPKDSPLRTVVVQLAMKEARQEAIMSGTLDCNVAVEFGTNALSLTMLATGRMRVPDDTFPATVLRAMIERHVDEHASPQPASETAVASE
jgi:hypothetical protein